MKKKFVIAALALAGLGGCTYYTPPPYSYVPVPCPPETTAPPPPAAGAQPATPPANASAACVAVVPNYPSYSYPGYYYPYPGYYYGPPAYGSVFIGGHFR